MSVRPQIPAVEGVQDKQVAGILGPMKMIIESMTGRSPNRKQIAALGPNAGLAALINKINEVVARVQGTDTGAASPPVAGIGAFTNFLAANILLNNTAAYFDGPSVQQGSSGTWIVVANTLVVDTSGSVQFSFKLWDGTTVIDSRTVNTPAANIASPVSLCGLITNPVGNIRLSANGVTSTAGVMLSNSSGNSRDSSMLAFRIA